MVSINKYFLEVANVGPSNLPIAPFGVINPSQKNKKLLMQAQSLSLKEPDKQASWMKRVLK
jgi:hypothetical protein